MPQFTVTFNGDTETYDLVIAGMTFGEARAVEKVCGVTFAEIMEKRELRSRIDVLQALIWVSMKRSHPTLTFSDIDEIAIDEIEWPDDETEGDQADDETGQDGEQLGDFVGAVDDAADLTSNVGV